jgi:hypothetical protein
MILDANTGVGVCFDAFQHSINFHIFEIYHRTTSWVLVVIILFVLACAPLICNWPLTHACTHTHPCSPPTHTHTHTQRQRRERAREREKL